jgi:predicted N-acetyltransferase YhbS
LLDDKTASPVLSLAAIESEEIVGHIIFTKVYIPDGNKAISARILAPLAVHPDVQKTGVGEKLIKEGLKLLKEDKVDIVFVLGHPDYYPRFGFVPKAEELGFKAPYPIPEEHADAWMVQKLSNGVIGRLKGTVQCSKVLNQPQHWRE